MVVEARGAAANFVVTYSGFPAEAQSAFQRAVDLWADLIVSDVPIRVNAQWVAFDNESTLGAAGPFVAQFGQGDSRPGGFEADVWYPTALVNARSGRDVDPGSPDITADFNSAFDRWHFGLGAPRPTQFDFTTVVLHELAHGLGFIGAFTVEGGTGNLMITLDGRDPFAFDLLARDCEGNEALDVTRYPRPSTALSDLLTGEALYLSGSTLDAATGGLPTPLYAPVAWNPGSSYSHLNEETFPDPNEQALMTPFFVSGERVLSPGALTCAILADLGWDLAGGCNGLITQQSPVVINIGNDPCAGTRPPDPTNPTPSTITSFSLNEFYPTLIPSSGSVLFSVTTAESVDFVEVRLYDMLGRLRLSRKLCIIGVTSGGICQETTAENTLEDVVLDLGQLGLSSGAYFIAFQAGDRQVVEKLTVVR